MSSPPPVDQRTAADISARLAGQPPQQGLLEELTGGAWHEYDPATGEPRGVSAALVGIFSRFAEIVIQRLNRVPEKGFLAFLDLLGAARLPPVPARVPLTFSLAAGRADEAVVPAGTKVAAQPAVGDTGPVVFEVERNLVVTSARLVSLITFDPEQDRYADAGARDPAVDPPFLAFQGEHPVEHALYVGDERLLGYRNLAEARLTFQLTRDLASSDPRQVAWEQWNGTAWAALVPLTDETSGLVNPGTLTVTFGPTAPLLPAAVGPRTSRWIRARLLTPITSSPDEVEQMVRASELPVITSVQVSVDVSLDADSRFNSGLQPDAGFAGTGALDLTKEYFPFGERPKRFDTFYLASLEGFGRDPAAITGAGQGPTVELEVTLAVLGVPGDDGVELVWECSTSDGWVEVGRSNEDGGLNGFEDPTRALTAHPEPDAGGRVDRVKFELPATAARAVVNGRDSCWLRVRITSGNYGLDARYGEENPPTFFPPSFMPPVISKIRIGYRFTAERPAEACLASNDLEYQDVTTVASFSPFLRGIDHDRPALALGFSVPKAGAPFPNATISLYASVAGASYGALQVPLAPDASTLAGAADTIAEHAFTVTNPWPRAVNVALAPVGFIWTATVSHPLLSLDPDQSVEVKVMVHVPEDAQPGESDRGFLQLREVSDPSVVHSASFATTAGTAPIAARPKLAWLYWNGTGWSPLSVRDGSQALTRPGLVEFLAPRDFTPHGLFGREHHWLRVRWVEGDYSVWPRIRQLLLNTALATQALTVASELRPEVLGSSTGAAHQVFRATKSPVLAGQRLEVREAEQPGAEELLALQREEGSDAVVLVLGAAGRPKEIWVRWHEVPDFYGSGPRDRHYVIDHLTGEIRFGDGVSGRIPPIGSSNVRLSRYQTGGGAAANRPAGTVSQMKTTVPYVDKVTNPEAAAGGAEAEPLEALQERMPRTLRHRDRAVTSEDYEDLAALASPEVARSICVPLRDLAADPLGASPRPGMVSVIVVPRTTDAKPQPALELLGRVEDYLAGRVPAGAGLRIVGPRYIRVDVRAEIGVVSLEDAGEVAAAVQERLDAFLHPLTGGLERRGWDFGRAPHRSDFLALIEGVAGVDYVRFLQIDQTEEVEGIRQTGRFLVYSGQHQVDLVFEEP